MRRATPEIGMDRLTVTETPESVRIAVDHSVRHIPDPDGLGRRTFEGWASIEGIDFQNEDTPPTAFVEAIQEYMAKNPVLVWHHNPELPIGKILRADVILGKGVYVVGEVFRNKIDRNSTTLDENKKLKPIVVPESRVPALRDLCNQVWEMLKAGAVRGLSWRGAALKLNKWSKEEGALYVENAHLFNLAEISLTPTQVHPGSQVVGVNVTAKALNTPAQGANKGECQMSDQNALNESLNGLLQGLHSLEDGATLSEEVLSKIGDVAKACGITVEAPQAQEVTSETPAPVVDLKALAELVASETQKALAPLKEKVESIANEPAARLSVGSTNPDQAQAKPGDNSNMPQKMTFIEACEKALQVMSDANVESEEFKVFNGFRPPPQDLMKMHSMVRQHRGDHSYLLRADKKEHLSPEIKLHPRTLRALKRLSV